MKLNKKQHVTKDGIVKKNPDSMKQKFLIYESVRRSGRTNMFDVNAVKRLSGGILSMDEIFDIMKNYGTYAKKWL